MSQIKHKILAAAFERTNRPVPVIPQWGNAAGDLFVQNLSAEERDAYSAVVRRANNGETVSTSAEMVALVLVDAAGERVFTTPDDIKSLAKGDPDALDIVRDVYGKLMEERAEAAKKLVTPSSN